MQGLLQISDGERGMVTRIVRDTDGALVIQAKQKADVIVDCNKRMAAMWDKHRMRGRPRMVAEIPMYIYWHLWRLGITEDRQALLRWLDRPDARFFRVDGGGRLSNPERSYAHAR